MPFLSTNANHIISIVSFISGDIARPFLPIIISNPSNLQELEVFALVDSGADECAFPSGFAAILGHNLKAGRQKRVQTGNGVAVAYGHSSKIKFDDYSTETITIDYLDNLNTPLLGMQSFLSRFVITLDYPEKTFSLEF